MVRLNACLLLMLFLGIGSGESYGQDNKPVIIPEKLQEIAADPKYRLSDRLGIVWDKATPEDTGRYLGFLAAANEIASTIAIKNDRKIANEFDYSAALATLCLYPPNKPPIVQPYWNKIIPAYYDRKVRSELDLSVGSIATSLPMLFEKGASDEAIMATFPDDQSNYFGKVINLDGFLK